MIRKNAYQDASRKRRYSEVESKKAYYAAFRMLRFARLYGTLTQLELEARLLNPGFMTMAVNRKAPD